MRNAARQVLLPLAGFTVVVLLWWAVARSGMAGSRLPSPGQVLVAAGDRFRRDDLLLDLRLSAVRVLIGVVVGAALAVPVGFLLAWFPTVRLMFDPLVSFFRALPPIALIPLVIVYLGIGEQARLSILVYAAFFSAVVVVYEGVAAVDDLYVRAGRALGATNFELFRRVVVPLTVPQVFVAVRVALGVCWATLVAAELIAAQRGLGAMIQKSASFFRLDDVFAGIILIGLTALVMDRLLGLLQGRLMRWQDRVVR